MFLYQELIRLPLIGGSLIVSIHTKQERPSPGRPLYIRRRKNKPGIMSPGSTYEKSMAIAKRAEQRVA